MPIRQWPLCERPREKLLERGAHSLSDAELLAVLLGSGTRGRSAVELARALISHFGSLRELLSALGPGADSPVIVVDDGSSDGTSDAAREAGAEVIRHARNLGKGNAGLTATDLTRAVLQSITSATIKAVTDAAENVGGDVKNLGGAGINKLKSGLGGLLGK